MFSNGGPMCMKFLVGSGAHAAQPGVFLCEVTSEGIRILSAFSGMENPSFVLAHPNGKWIYAVEEIAPEGRIRLLRRNEFSSSSFPTPACHSDGSTVTVFSSHGAHPCHLATDSSGSFLTASNYTSGNLSLFRIETDGSLSFLQQIVHHGQGPHAIRQASPHIHFSAFSDDLLFTCDLGTDTVNCCYLDRDAERLIELSSKAVLPPGFGPRHLLVHPELHRLYVIAEMGAAVCVYSTSGLPEDSKDLPLLQICSTLPENIRKDQLHPADADSFGAAIRFLSPDRICVSTRAHNSLAFFRINQDGLLDREEICTSGGSCPRDLDARTPYIITANQYSSCISLHQKEEGSPCRLLTQFSGIPLPTCIRILT